jgi:hypothetical protein
VERQTAAMRGLSRRAFPEPGVVPDDAPALIEAARIQRCRQAAAAKAAALRRARVFRPGYASPFPRSLIERLPARGVAKAHIDNKMAKGPAHSHGYIKPSCERKEKLKWSIDPGPEGTASSNNRRQEFNKLTK